jgi:hypothetical protein
VGYTSVSLPEPEPEPEITVKSPRHFLDFNGFPDFGLEARLPGLPWLAFQVSDLCVCGAAHLVFVRALAYILSGEVPFYNFSYAIICCVYR